MCLNLYTATGYFVYVLVCYALYRVNMCYLSLCYLFISVRGVLFVLERLFGVKGHDCVAFRVWLSGNDCRRVLFGDLFFEGWLCHVLCVMYNLRRLRLFCTGSGLAVLLCVGKNNLPALDHAGRCRRALPACHPWVLPSVDHVNRWWTCFYEL